MSSAHRPPSTGAGGLLPGEPAAPAWLERSAAVGVRLLVLAAVLWVVSAFVANLTLLAVALLVGLLVAGVLQPVMHWATSKGVPRTVTALTLVLLLLVVVLGVVGAIGLRVSDQLPQLRDQLESASSQLSSTLGIDIPGGSSSAGSGTDGGSSGQSGSGSSEGSSSSGGSSGESASSGSGLPSGVDGVLSATRGVADVLIGFFLTLAFTFLYLRNGADMWHWGLGKLGGRLREDVDAAGWAAWSTVGAYVRGLTIVALFDAVGIGLGLVLLGVPLALTLAVLQFVASYIPTIGSFVAGAVAVAIAWVGGGLGTALAVLALVVVVQQIGNDVIEPYVMGRSLPMNALMVLVAVTAGGLLWGIAGALLFVPLTAAVSAAAHELWVRHGSRPIAGA